MSNFNEKKIECGRKKCNKTCHYKNQLFYIHYVDTKIKQNHAIYIYIYINDIFICYIISLACAAVQELRWVRRRFFYTHWRLLQPSHTCNFHLDILNVFDCWYLIAPSHYLLFSKKLNSPSITIYYIRLARELRCELSLRFSFKRSHSFCFKKHLTSTFQTIFQTVYEKQPTTISISYNTTNVIFMLHLLEYKATNKGLSDFDPTRRIGPNPQIRNSPISSNDLTLTLKQTMEPERDTKKSSSACITSSRVRNSLPRRWLSNGWNKW